MSESTVSSNDAGAEGAATAETPAEGQTAAVTTDQLPEWARTKISEANAEAAKYRTERNELRTTLESAKALEDTLNQVTTAHAETQAALAATNLDLLKLTTALNAGVSGSAAVDFAARLRGDTAEALAADAQEALKLYGASIGRTPATDPTPVTGEAIALNDHDGLLSELSRALGTELA